MRKRLLVIDGADHGLSHWLPESGSVIIGNNSKTSDICLHDLYVSRAHCELAIEEGRIVVTARDTPGGRPSPRRAARTTPTGHFQAPGATIDPSPRQAAFSLGHTDGKRPARQPESRARHCRTQTPELTQTTSA